MGSKHRVRPSSQRVAAQWLPTEFTRNSKQQAHHARSQLPAFGPQAFFLPAAMDAFLLAATSPSPSHLLALINWITLITCLPAMTGKLMPARIHGTVLSILFARAISKAPALHGLENKVLGLGWAGEPGWVDTTPLLFAARREGDSRGEEKERR